MNPQENNISKLRYMDRYISWRQQTAALLEKLVMMAAQLNFERKAEELRASIQRLEDDRFEVMVVGEFSNGKSTFINALLGTDILPSAITPCTALLTRIAYGPEQDIRIIMRSGDEERLSAEAFKRLIAPEVPDQSEGDRLRARREAERIAEIAYADVRLPTALGSDGIILIDSPGTNDMDAAREAITNRYIPNCDAAVLVIHGMRPLTQSEKSFLYRIKDADINKIFIIISFKDLLRTEDDRQRVVDRVRREISEIMQAEHVYLVSSRHELLHQKHPDGQGLPPMRTALLAREATGFAELGEGLQRFLAVDRGAAKLDKPINRAIRTADDLIRYHIDFERRTLRNRIADAQQAMGGLRDQLDRTRNQGIAAMEAMKSRLSTDGMELRDWYKEKLGDIAKLAKETMDRTFPHHRNIAMTKESIEKAVATREKELQTELERRMKTYEDHAIMRANKDMQAELGRYESLLGSVLGGEFTVGASESAKHGEGLVGDTAFSLRSPLAGIILDKAEELLDNGGFLRTVSGIGLGIVGGLLEGASRIFDWLVGGSSPSPYEQLKEEVNNRFSTPISDKCKQLEKYWSNRMNKLTALYEQEIEHRVDDSRKQLDTIVRNYQLTEDETQRKLEALDEQERDLRHIADCLKALNEEVQHRAGA